MRKPDENTQAMLVTLSAAGPFGASQVDTLELQAYLNGDGGG